MGLRADNCRMTQRTRQKIYLKPWRKFRGLTQEQLGFLMAGDDETPVSHAHISHLENGQKQYTQDMLERLAAALDCEPYDLLIGPPGQLDSLHAVAAQIPEAERGRAIEILKAFIPKRPANRQSDAA